MVHDAKLLRLARRHVRVPLQRRVHVLLSLAAVRLYDVRQRLARVLGFLSFDDDIRGLSRDDVVL